MVVSLLLYCVVCLPFPHNQQRLLQTVTLELITETITEPPRLTLPPPRRSTAFQYSFGSPRSLLEVSIPAEYITERPKYDGNIFSRKSPCHCVERHHVINIPRFSPRIIHGKQTAHVLPNFKHPLATHTPFYFRFTALTGAFKQTSCLYPTSPQRRS